MESAGNKSNDCKILNINRIVLIGNGFDLAHGLPTRYTDFIDGFWDNLMRNASLDQCNYDNKYITLDTGFDSFSIRVVMGEKEKYTYKSICDAINQFAKSYSSQYTRFHIKNDFVKHISKITTCNSWIDIENEYYKFLCYHIHKESGSKYYYESISKLNSDFGMIKKELEKYLSRVLDENIIEPNEFIKKIIYSNFNKRDFAEIVKIKFAQIPASLVDNYILGNVLFLNFNYTDLEKHYIDKEISSEIIHIHGELNNDKNPMVFGYGDELEENYAKLEKAQDNELLKNIKSIKYLETDNYKRLLSFISSGYYQIIILGHSCGNSDRTLLNTLFEHENCVSIKPYFFIDNNGKDNFSDIVRNISRNFTNKNSLRDKVVNKNYCEPFCNMVSSM